MNFAEHNASACVKASCVRLFCSLSSGFTFIFLVPSQECVCSICAIFLFYLFFFFILSGSLLGVGHSSVIWLIAFYYLFLFE